MVARPCALAVMSLEHHLIRPLRVVSQGQFDRVAHVPQLASLGFAELYASCNLGAVHVQARDDSLCQHNWGRTMAEGGQNKTNFCRPTGTSRAGAPIRMRSIRLGNSRSGKGRLLNSTPSFLRDPSSLSNWNSRHPLSG